MVFVGGGDGEHSPRREEVQLDYRDEARRILDELDRYADDDMEAAIEYLSMELETLWTAAAEAGTGLGMKLIELHDPVREMRRYS